MTITGVITAILIGIVVGVLGRLLVPGRQPIGMLLTILVGIVSAFIGTAIARAIGIPTATSGIDWLELLVQVIVAALGQTILTTAGMLSGWISSTVSVSPPLMVPEDRMVDLATGTRFLDKWVSGPSGAAISWRATSLV